MPFIRLAKRILSISANSASCERLFSIFGNTLTKLRNRLGTNTLTNLAELKMFLRDQHLQRDTKKRLKNIFQGRLEDCNHMPSSQPPDNEGNANPSPSTATQADDLPDPNDEPMDADPESRIARRQRLAGRSFRSIVNTHSRLTSEDETDQQPVTVPLTIKNRIPIQRLFDFTQSHWVEKYARHPLRSFDEELALYELLDLDGQGEADADVDVDEPTGDILCS